MLCLGLAAQWRSGVQWKTERGFLRYVRKHLHAMFPGLTSQSAFNRRLRRLWGGFTPHLRWVQVFCCNKRWRAS